MIADDTAGLRPEDDTAALAAGLETIRSRPHLQAAHLTPGERECIIFRASKTEGRMLDAARLGIALRLGRPPSRSLMLRRAVELLTERTTAALKDPALMREELDALRRLAGTKEAARTAPRGAEG